jgi:hypothetical protein
MFYLVSFASPLEGNQPVIVNTPPPKAGDFVLQLKAISAKKCPLPGLGEG